MLEISYREMGKSTGWLQAFKLQHALDEYDLAEVCFHLHSKKYHEEMASYWQHEIARHGGEDV